jgi:O-antigen/teichoic acid export membrane protein
MVIQRKSSGLTLTTVIMAMSLLSYVFLYGLNAFMARYLGPEGYGQYSIAIQVLSIAMWFSLLGTNNSSKRYLSKFLQQNNDEQVLQYIGWNLKYVAYTFSACIVISLLLCAAMLVLDHTNVKELNSYELALYMFWVAPLFGLSTWLCGVLLNNDNVLASYAINNLLYFALFLFFSYCAYLFIPLHINNLQILGVFFAVAIVWLAIVSLVTLKHLPVLRLLTREHLKAVKIYDSLPWLKTAIRLALVNLVYVLMAASQFFIIRMTTGNNKQVALFAACYTIASFFSVLAHAIYTPIKAHISHLSSTREGCNLLQKKINMANSIMLLLSVVILTLLYFYGAEFLHHFGASFVVAKQPLLLLAVAFSLSGFAFLASYILSYSGLESHLLKINIVIFFIQVVLGVGLTYYYGLIGIVLSVLITAVLVCFIYSISIRTKLPLKPFSLF